MRRPIELVAFGIVFGSLGLPSPVKAIAEPSPATEASSPRPKWTATTNQENAAFGHSVASAGDVNGDGFDDVVVGAPWSSDGQTNEGLAYLYLGSPSGLKKTASWTAESDQANAAFGYSVASAGDVNGDGFDEVVVGAFAYVSGQFIGGRAYLYLGSPVGLGTVASWTADGDQAGAEFGLAVASAGDVNGDGYDDVLVGAPFEMDGSSEGRAYLYLGSPSGLAIAPSWTAETGEFGLFGSSLASAGDVNEDGYADVIVGAYQFTNGQPVEGRAFLYLGSALGLSSSPSWTAEADEAEAFFGYSVASAGDVNGDGYDDVVVGAPQYGRFDYTLGRAYVYFGSLSGLETAASWIVESTQVDSYLGNSVASAGDVNGDGYDDVLVGARLYDHRQIDDGRAYLYVGSATGLATTAAWNFAANQVESYLGVSVASAGDVNGDGLSNVIVGADGYSRGGIAAAW
jgi:hypothetical protein